jgi:acetyl esterase/lipase
VSPAPYSEILIVTNSSFPVTNQLLSNASHIFLLLKLEMDSSKPNKPEMTPGQLFQFEPAVVRQNMAKFFKKDQPYNPMTEVGSVTETSFKSIDQNDVNLRVYTPEGEGPFPAIVFFHGGGFVLCSLDTHDTLCRALCKVVGAVVISVDYRLAPEVNVHDDISI